MPILCLANVYWTGVQSLIKHVCSSHLSVKRSDMRCAHCLGGCPRHLAQAQSSNRKSWLIVFWDRQQPPYAAIIHGAALLDNTGLLLLHILFVCFVFGVSVFCFVSVLLGPHMLLPPIAGTIRRSDYQKAHCFLLSVHPTNVAEEEERR